MLQTNTYTNKRLLPLYPGGDVPPHQPIKLATGTYVYGQLVRESGTLGTYQALTDASDAGPTHMLETDVVVTSDGQHWNGAQQASNDVGAGDIYTLAYAVGGGLAFDTRDLCIDNARTAITNVQIAGMGAKLLNGTAAAGTIQF
jgi:hypothetical protein